MGAWQVRTFQLFLESFQSQRREPFLRADQTILFLQQPLPKYQFTHFVCVSQCLCREHVFLAYAIEMVTNL